MGMFDYINFEIECPNCGDLIKDFQSKDDRCGLYHLDFWEVNNFYSFCKKCETWVEFNLHKRPNRMITIEDFEKTIKFPGKIKD